MTRVGHRMRKYHDAKHVAIGMDYTFCCGAGSLDEVSATPLQRLRQHRGWAWWEQVCSRIPPSRTLPFEGTEIKALGMPPHLAIALAILGKSLVRSWLSAPVPARFLKNDMPGARKTS